MSGTSEEAARAKKRTSKRATKWPSTSIPIEGFFVAMQREKDEKGHTYDFRISKFEYKISSLMLIRNFVHKYVAELNEIAVRRMHHQASSSSSPSYIFFFLSQLVSWTVFSEF